VDSVLTKGTSGRGRASYQRGAETEKADVERGWRGDWAIRDNAAGSSQRINETGGKCEGTLVQDSKNRE